MDLQWLVTRGERRHLRWQWNVDGRGGRAYVAGQTFETLERRAATRGRSRIRSRLSAFRVLGCRVLACGVALEQLYVVASEVTGIS